MRYLYKVETRKAAFSFTFVRSIMGVALQISPEVIPEMRQSLKATSHGLG